MHYVANLLVNAVQLHEHVEEQDVVELVSEVTWLQDMEPDPEAIGLQNHTVEEEAFPSESKEEFPVEPTPGKQEESRGAVQRGAEEVVEVEEERTNSVPLCRASASPGVPGLTNELGSAQIPRSSPRRARSKPEVPGVPSCTP